MKKILAILALMLAFTVSAQGQEKKVSPESKGRQDAVELADYLKLNSTELEDFTRLFQKKHEMLSDPNLSAEKKKQVYTIMERKIEGTLESGQMEKLRANPTLLNKLTH